MEGGNQEKVRRLNLVPSFEFLPPMGEGPVYNLRVPDPSVGGGEGGLVRM